VSLAYTLRDMDKTKTALERAWDLARSGRYSTVTEVADAVSREGYSRDQLDGPTLRRQLAILIKEARASDNA
jgi:hypothetical protein